MSTKLRDSILLLVLCFAAGAAAFFLLDWSDWVKGWFGTHFKLLSGSVMGFLIARYLFKLRPSQIEDPLQRAICGFSVIFLVGMFAVGAAVGV